ncbi:MAG: hypothetical protein DME84_07665, partial [Verrucomicrobia bacterium]
THRQRPSVAANLLGQSIFFCSPSTRAFPFSSQENFFTAKKIKFIFFLSISKRVSSLKPAGEGGDKAHVNKL